MTVNLPANLPPIERAKLPQSYEAAKAALAECARIDECKEWSDRMEALASYARQSNDDTLYKAALRIKARATDRCGELLRQFDGRGDHLKSGGVPTSSQKEVGRKAGLSKDQIVQAVRVNNVPREQFELLVESDDPPTVTKLAEMGKKPRPIVDIGERKPEEFAAATKLLGLISGIVRDSDAVDLSKAIRGCTAKEIKELLANIDRVREWLRNVDAVLRG